MPQQRFLPDLDRLSVLTATILLALASTQFINIPSRDFSYQFPGFFLSFQLNANTVVSIFVAGLTGTGTDWLLRTHPSLDNRSTLIHLLLPALTSWAIGVLLNNLPRAPFWWLVFSLGGAILVLVLVAEYIVVEPTDIRQPLATAGLTAISFSLLLILAISLRQSGARLFFLFPTLVLTTWMVSSRAINLRLVGQWALLETLPIALITGQVTAAIHYWPLNPITFGLAILAPSYALTIFIGNIESGRRWERALVEPALSIALIVGIAQWIQGSNR